MCGSDEDCDPDNYASGDCEDEEEQADGDHDESCDGGGDDNEEEEEEEHVDWGIGMCTMLGCECNHADNEENDGEEGDVETLENVFLV